MDSKKNIDAVYFDMDGTIADLYGQQDWLTNLRAENPKPYINAEPMVDMVALSNVIKRLQKQGVKVGVISWLSMYSSKEYKRKVRNAKRAWLKKHLSVDFDFIHLVQYGTPKHKVAKIKNSIIIDDDDKVLSSWKGMTINARYEWLNPLIEMTT